MESLIRGRVWKFGDAVDTDVMAPWNTISLAWEERRRAVLHVRPEFAEDVKPGDLIVAGRNWGCGSSREQAPENLKLLGVGGVVAESFGRIDFRNCVAMAFPNLASPGIHNFAPLGYRHLLFDRYHKLRPDYQLHTAPFLAYSVNCRPAVIRT